MFEKNCMYNKSGIIVLCTINVLDFWFHYVMLRSVYIKHFIQRIVSSDRVGFFLDWKWNSKILDSQKVHINFGAPISWWRLSFVGYRYMNIIITQDTSASTELGTWYSVSQKTSSLLLVGHNYWTIKSIKLHFTWGSNISNNFSSNLSTIKS